MADEVGIRELRQNLSKYVRRIREGERFIVTERGKPVATLGPPPEEEDYWERWIAEGRMTRPTLTLDEVGPPIDLGDPYAGTKALEEQREERLRRR